MKKHVYLLLSASVFVSGFNGAIAQLNQRPQLPTSERNKTITRPTYRYQQNTQQTEYPLLPANPLVHESNSRGYGPEVLIGQTYYDLQTNSSVCPRIENHGDGTLAAIWTFSKTSSSGVWPDRGMAYHAYDGNAWTKLPDYAQVDNISRIENVRVGFGSIASVPGVGDIIVAHQTAISATQVTRNTSFTEEQFITTPFTTMPLIWPRMRTGGPDGKSVHIIGLTEPASGGEFNGTKYLGINGCLLYNRSTDGGASFDKLMVLPPGIDSTIYSGFGGDGYALDVRGNTVAFVAGDLTTRIAMWKSTDNGETWTTRIIKSFPYEPWKDQLTDANGDGTVADSERVETNDGSFAIVIDNNDQVHVFYGAMELLNSSATDGNLSYFPGVGAIQYWNEDFAQGDSTRTIATAVDEDGDNTLNIAVSFANGTTIPYGSGLTTFPSAGIDADGVLYLSYSGSKEGDEFKYLGDGPSFKHLYFIQSKDGGQTWSAPKDITGDENDGFDPLAEYAFASMARKVDQNIHVVYQRDFVPGSAVTIDNGQIHPFDTPNDIVYIKVPKDFLEVGIKPVEKAELNVSLQPNPASDQALLKFELKQNDRISVSVSNLLGQTVLNFSAKDAAPGFHTITLNTSDLTSGIYLVNLKTGNSLVSKKLVVKN
jgi:hypothetical protein